MIEKKIDLNGFLYFGISTILLMTLLGSIFLSGDYTSSYAARATVSGLPTVDDNNIVVEEYASGLEGPVQMSFINDNKILVTEKDTGLVQMIVDGKKSLNPLLKVEVKTKDEMGLLGISTMTDDNHNKFVYLYLTQPEGSGKGNVNNIYRYELKDDMLTNPVLLITLPANPGPSHMGGILTIGPDNNLYASVGDMFPTKLFNTIPQYHTKAQNYIDGKFPDGRAGILIMDKDGKPVGDGILGEEFPLNMYYAYGIKNGFGIDFDPVSGHLWETENGPSFADEINMVEPGFNGGWRYIMGIWTVDDKSGMGHVVTESDIQKLETFDGKGKYREPEFIWKDTVAPTAIKFLNSDKYGNDYKNDLFVGDAKFGNIYHFKLNEERNGLILDGKLKDKIADNDGEFSTTVIGSGFGAITDMEVGPDGYLYVLSFDKQDGKIFRLVPK